MYLQCTKHVSYIVYFKMCTAVTRICLLRGQFNGKVPDKNACNIWALSRRKVSLRSQAFFSELVNATKMVLHGGEQSFIEGIGQYNHIRCGQSTCSKLKKHEFCPVLFRGTPTFIFQKKGGIPIKLI